MRILVFYQYFGTHKGSWSTRFYEFTRRWVDTGHQVTAVTAPYEKSDIIAAKFIERQVIDGINLIIINAPDSNRYTVLKRGINAILFSLTATWFAITQKTDIVICSSGPITIGIPGLIAKLFGKKFVFEVRDLWPGGGIEMGKIKKKWQIKFALGFEKLLYNKANIVITCSEGQKKNINKRFPIVNCLTIPHGGDLSLFDIENNNSHIQNNTKLFTHIGSLGFIHNCKLILEAATLIKNLGRDKNITIIFIGDGAERKELETIKYDLELNNVEFLGLMPKIDLPKWVKCSTATLFTTLDNEIQNTSCPNKIFDSFAAGIPVIQTTSGWIKDLIDRENCGLNVSANNANELALAIISMADNHKLQSELSINASRVAKTLFDRDKLAQRYLDALIELK